MMKRTLYISLLSICYLFGGDPVGLSKFDYYNHFIAPRFGRKPLPNRLSKISSYDDRKRSVLDKGNMVLRLSNAAICGYDR